MAKAAGRAIRSFYYPQEDALHTAATKFGWKWLVTRPCLVIGVAQGA